MNSIEFNTLLQNIKNVKCLEKLYNYYFGRIVIHVSQKYKNGEKFAQDVAQEVFFYLINLEKKPFIKNPNAWVYSCCDHIAIKKIKKDEGMVALTEETVIAQPIILEEELYGSFYDVISQFDETTQQIIKLVYVYGYSKEETAKELHIKSSTVRQKHSRAIKKLKKMSIDVTKIKDNTPYISKEV